jgi:hypothetical protein
MDLPDTFQYIISHLENIDIFQLSMVCKDWKNMLFKDNEKCIDFITRLNGSFKWNIVHDCIESLNNLETLYYFYEKSNMTDIYNYSVLLSNDKYTRYCKNLVNTSIIHEYLDYTLYLDQRRIYLQMFSLGKLDLIEYIRTKCITITLLIDINHLMASLESDSVECLKYAQKHISKFVYNIYGGFEKSYLIEKNIHTLLLAASSCDAINCFKYLTDSYPYSSVIMSKEVLSLKYFIMVFDNNFDDNTKRKIIIHHIMNDNMDIVNHMCRSLSPNVKDWIKERMYIKR